MAMPTSFLNVSFRIYRDIYNFTKGNSCQTKSYVETHPNHKAEDNGTSLQGQGCRGWISALVIPPMPSVAPEVPPNRVWKSLIQTTHFIDGEAETQIFARNHMLVSQDGSRVLALGLPHRGHLSPSRQPPLHLPRMVPKPSLEPTVLSRPTFLLWAPDPTGFWTELFQKKRIKGGREGRSTFLFLKVEKALIIQLSMALKHF